MVVEILAGALLVLFFLIVFLVWHLKSVQAALARLRFDKQSQSVRYGKMSEQFFPFMKDYPYNAEGFRFLGTPIDGVQFEKDKIVFVEFKSGSSQLSAKQKDIKSLVEKKKVEFKEVRVE